MFSMKVKFVVFLLIAGALSACAAPATQAPAVEPTNVVIAPTEAPANTQAATITPAPTVAGESALGTTVSFTNDILPIIQSRCINCHGGDRTEKGLNLKTYNNILTGSENGAVVIPGDSDHSLLAELVANQKMPKRGPRLTPPQVQLIIDWINQGALNN
jgi:hypothetical protein